jgi:hypothetical protein
MVLRALGVDVSVGEARTALERARGAPGDYSGASPEMLATVLAGRGLRPAGLLPSGRASRWSPEAMRQELVDGHPIIALTRESLLPGAAAPNGGADHYVVLIGMDGDDVVYHDPALPEPGETPRTVPMGILLGAMAASSRPFTAVAVAPDEGRYPLRVQAPAPPPQVAPPAPFVQPAVAPVPVPEPAPQPEVVRPGRWWERLPPVALAVALLGLLIALGVAYAVYASSGPVGTLVFLGAGGERLGELTMNGWRHTVRWDADDCARHLPAVDAAALRVDRGPDVAGRPTVRLGLVFGDGHVVSRIMQDLEAYPLNETASRSVQYLAARAESRPAPAFGSLPGSLPGALPTALPAALPAALTGVAVLEPPGALSSWLPREKG